VPSATGRPSGVRPPPAARPASVRHAVPPSWPVCRSPGPSPGTTLWSAGSSRGLPGYPNSRAGFVVLPPALASGVAGTPRLGHMIRCVRRAFRTVDVRGRRPLSPDAPRLPGPDDSAREAWAGARDALTTVVPSILAYGAVWGGLARQAGLSLGELVAMCVLVTAGTAQFVALPMLAAGAPTWLLVVTTYVVNLRHYLMAASLAPYFAHLSRGRLALLAHGVTDESYALTMARFARRASHPAYFAGSAATTYAAWYVGAAAGGVLGGRIPDPHRYGLDFVFPAVFIAILARTIRTPWQAAVAVAAAGIALAMKSTVGGTWHIAVAGLGASVFGVWLAPAGEGAPAREARG
jgi:4-azaleucine resistance transporter AzlC